MSARFTILLTHLFASALAASAHAAEPAREAAATAQADDGQAAAIATASRQFSAAVQKWAQLIAPGVPWNATNTMNRIDYAPVYLWAAGSASGYTGNSATCNFPSGATGTAVPGVTSPVKLSGAAITPPSASPQAAATKAALTTAGALDASGKAALLPANFGADWQGVFCAAVRFNQPTANQVRVSTWFVPATGSMSAKVRGGDTSASIVLDAGRKLVTTAADAQPLVGTAVRISGSYSTPR